MMFTVGAYFSYKNMLQNEHSKDTKILFYKIQIQTDRLLSKLMFEYFKNRQMHLLRHKAVVDYLQEYEGDVLSMDLSEILAKVDDNESSYEIYITDENLTIRNSTFKKDIGFDLSFAKDDFDMHFEQNITGICSPLFEKYSEQFMSYSDSYLMQTDSKRKVIVQLSYTYKESAKELKKLQKLIAENVQIVNAEAYVMVDNGFANAIVLKNFSAYKPDVLEIMKNIKDAESLTKVLKQEELVTYEITRDDTEFLEMYIATKSSIDKKTKLVFSLLLDESKLTGELKNLDVLMSIIVLIFLLIFLLLLRVRTNENRFDRQDSFVQSSMHEIKTPLSIITLNNELRELELGRDEYSSEIENAIKTLKNSYDDMSFTLTKDNFAYPVEILSLEQTIGQRVAYFSGIALSKSKTIDFKGTSSCKVKMSQIELIRLIDNNLSNAIKYGEDDSVISVVLKENKLSIHNKGKSIKNKKKIFEKYVRENSVVGGHGLGLSIVKEIAKSYDIAIELTSSIEDGTKFSYSFKCHVGDI